jgi:DNA polymerase I-like protein with 3'-5' exonuclease and polymerase domains
VAFIHDEVQLEADEEIADEVGKLMVESFEEAGRYFNFRCPITGEYKVGNNWAETH